MQTQTHDTLIMLGRQGKAQGQHSVKALHPSDPFGAGRHIHFKDDKGFATGHVAISGVIAVADLFHAEVIVIVAGWIQCGAVTYRSGEALVLPKAFSGSLSIAPDSQWFFCTMADERRSSEHAAIRLDAERERPASAGPAAEVLFGPAPQCHALNLFTDASGMRAGVWDVSTPCERSFVPHKVHELMHVIEGEMTLTHRNGSHETIVAGDTVFVPRGAPYAWKSTLKVVKYYCVM